jgi:hypothetical protein
MNCWSWSESTWTSPVHRRLAVSGQKIAAVFTGKVSNPAPAPQPRRIRGSRSGVETARVGGGCQLGPTEGLGGRSDRHQSVRLPRGPVPRSRAGKMYSRGSQCPDRASVTFVTFVTIGHYTLPGTHRCAVWVQILHDYRVNLGVKPTSVPCVSYPHSTYSHLCNRDNPGDRIPWGYDAVLDEWAS